MTTFLSAARWNPLSALTISWKKRDCRLQLNEVPSFPAFSGEYDPILPVNGCSTSTGLWAQPVLAPWHYFGSGQAATPQGMQSRSSELWREIRTSEVCLVSPVNETHCVCRCRWCSGLLIGWMRDHLDALKSSVWGCNKLNRRGKEEVQIVCLYYLLDRREAGMMHFSVMSFWVQFCLLRGFSSINLNVFLI